MQNFRFGDACQLTKFPRRKKKKKNPGSQFILKNNKGDESTQLLYLQINHLKK